MEKGIMLEGVRVLLVDDDRTQREVLRNFFFSACGAEVEEAACGEDAIDVVAAGGINVVITDVCMPGMNGIDLVRHLRDTNPEIPVLVHTCFGNAEMRRDALRAGAFRVLDKPVDLDKLASEVCQAYQHHLSLCEQVNSKVELKYRDTYSYLVGNSPKMQSIFEYIEKAAVTDETVLLLGATGTGKELFARAVHDISKRARQEYIPINCGCVPEELLESELFGHVKGAFTGAQATKKGKFEAADQGTIFLDEIGDMQMKLQVKLLRVLQERKIEPVGATKEKPVNIRVIAATHQDLDRMIENKQFRQDLYFRLAVCVIRIPALRERKEDIPLLVDHFIKRFNEANGTSIEGVTEDCMEFLMDYSWPGNIRELESTIRHLAVMRSEGFITADEAKKSPSFLGTAAPAAPVFPRLSIPHVTFGDDGTIDLSAAMRSIEDSLILEAMAKAKHNKKEAARLLGLKRTTLIEKLKKRGFPCSAPA